MEAEATSLPPIEQRYGIYSGKFRDSTPQTRPAGKLTTAGDSAIQCLTTPARPESPAVIKRFRATFRPEAGSRTVFYAKAFDPHLKWAEEMKHGVNTQASLGAGELVNPQPLTKFQYKQFSKHESLYLSHKKAPLGHSHDQTGAFPPNLYTPSTVFGVVTEKDGSAGALVSPPKAHPQVEEESAVGHDMYVLSHGDFEPGERIVRNYSSGNYSPTDAFGRPTPHDNTGGMTYKSLKWVHELQAAKAAKVVSKRLDSFREKTQPQLGKTLDPIKETMKISEDHTFGALVKPDEYGAGDLIHQRGRGAYLRGLDHQRGAVAALRHQLKKANFQSFDNLLHAFQFYDKSGSGKITVDNLATVCYQFGLPAEAELLAQVMEYCDVDTEGSINYLTFANFLNYNLPSGVVEVSTKESADPDTTVTVVKEAKTRRVNKQIDGAIGGHRTSSAMINAVVGGLSTKDFRCYGVPTVRYDLPAPRFKSISDHKNYGDEPNAGALVNPSVYSNLGVGEKDFLLPRNREEIRELFTSIGVEMTLDSFDTLYEKAAALHPKGYVSVESFRSILDEIQAKKLQQLETQPMSKLAVA